MQSDDQKYFNRPPWKVQHSESGATDPVKEGTDDMEEAVTEGSRKTLACTTHPYSLRSAADVTVNICKNRVAIAITLN